MSRRDGRRRSTYASRSRAHREAERTSRHGRRRYARPDLPIFSPGWTLEDEIENSKDWYDARHGDLEDER